MAQFDARSEKNLKTLVPAAEQQARLFLQTIRDAGIDAKIIGGNRTYAEQDALYAQGRTKPGKIVTNAKGGYSNHNFGVAWDIGIFVGSDYLGNSPQYDEAGAIGKSLGLEWGGDFNTIVDKPHFQCRTGKSLAQLRQLKKKGLPIPVISEVQKVSVLSSSNQTNVPALFMAARTWVGIKDFTDEFKGTLVDAGGSPFYVTVGLGGIRRRLKGITIGGVGYVKFADLNQLLNLDFMFNSQQKTLTIL